MIHVFFWQKNIPSPPNSARHYCNECNRKFWHNILFCFIYVFPLHNLEYILLFTLCVANIRKCVYQKGCSPTPRFSFLQSTRLPKLTLQPRNAHRHQSCLRLLCLQSKPHLYIYSVFRFVVIHCFVVSTM